MRKKIRFLLTGLLLLILCAGVAFRPVQAEGQPGLPVRPAHDLLAVVTLNASNPYCYHPVKDNAMCYINWRNINAFATPSTNAGYLTLSINNKLRVKMMGVFEQSFSFQNDMLGRGLEVTCGLPGSGGETGAGATYNYMVKADFQDGSSQTISGSVTCPSYQGSFYLPALRK
jgi:hypothetical protein